MHKEHNNLKVSSGGVAAKVDMTSPTAIELLPLVWRLRVRAFVTVYPARSVGSSSSLGVSFFHRAVPPDA
eukprot:6260676-Amphidinium_carterae.1